MQPERVISKPVATTKPSGARPVPLGARGTDRWLSGGIWHRDLAHRIPMLELLNHLVPSRLVRSHLFHLLNGAFWYRIYLNSISDHSVSCQWITWRQLSLRCQEWFTEMRVQQCSWHGVNRLSAGSGQPGTGTVCDAKNRWKRRHVQPWPPLWPWHYW